MSPDFLKIANKKFQSRLILGTGNYPNVDENLKSIEKSGTEILTIAVRRVNNENLKKFINFRKKYNPFVNTNGYGNDCNI